MIGDAVLIAKCWAYMGSTSKRRFFFFFSNGEIYQQDEHDKDYQPYIGGWPYCLSDCQDIRDAEKFHELFSEWED